MDIEPKKALPLNYQQPAPAVTSAIARGIAIASIVMGVTGAIYRPVVWATMQRGEMFPTSARIWETAIVLEHIAQIVGGVMCLRHMRIGKAVMLIWATFELCYQVYYIGSEIYLLATGNRSASSQLIILCRYANAVAIYSAFPAIVIVFAAREGFACFTYDSSEPAK